MPSKTYKVPPYCHWEFRCSDTFYVYSGDTLLGPDTATARRFTVETSGDPLELKIDVMKDARTSTLAKVRPSPYEPNDGVPAEVQMPIQEPTIQELIRTYIRQAVPEVDNDVETPDEFLDFDMDDEGELLHSPYEYQEMQEQFMPEEEPQKSSDQPTASEDQSETEQTKDDQDPSLAEPAL